MGVASPREHPWGLDQLAPASRGLAGRLISCVREISVAIVTFAILLHRLLTQTNARRSFSVPIARRQRYVLIRTRSFNCSCSDANSDPGVGSHASQSLVLGCFSLSGEKLFHSRLNVLHHFSMMHLLGSLVRVILAVSMFVGLITLPVHTIAINDTYPANRPNISLPRETLFIWFSGIILGYLLLVELRLVLANQLSVREWVPYPVAAQVLYEELKDREVVFRLVRESDHPKPVEAVMAAWVQDGLHKGFVNVRGYREYSDMSEEVPQDSALVEVVLFSLPDGDQSNEVSAKRLETKEYWRGLTVLRSSLKKYLRYLEDDTPNFERQLVAKEQA